MDSLTPVTDLFSGYQAVTPQFKVVQTDKRGRPLTEERLRGDQAEKSAKPTINGRREREADPRETRTVFVGNLPADINRRKLKQLFSPHGRVASVRLRSIVVEKGKLPVRVAKRQQKQVTSSTINAYVVFEEEEQAEKALLLNGASVGDRHVRVDLAGRAKDHTHRRSVFVGGLPYSTDEEELREVFTKFGEVESVRVVREPITGIGKGFGFVTFADESGMRFALQHNRHMVLNGQQLRIMRSRDMRARETAAKFPGIQTRRTVKSVQKDIRTGSQKEHSGRDKGGGINQSLLSPKDRTAERRGSVRAAGSGFESNPVRPSRTFHKKKEARQRERENRKKLERKSVRAKPVKHNFKKAHSKPS